MDEESLSVFARLKRHRLYGAVVAYAVVAGFLIQLVSRAFPYFGWAAVVPAIIVLLLLGFPIVVVLAWLLIEPKTSANSDSWQRHHWKLSALATAAVITAVVISGFYALPLAHRHEVLLPAPVPAAIHAQTAIPAKSIAVLPFENLSADKNNEYFVAGIQDLMLTKLATIGDLKVISRTSTAKYVSHPDDLKAIGQQLGVATILEGSVQKQGNQVLINVQLFDAANDTHLWAQSYQRQLNDVFSVEGEVAEQIAAALEAKLSLGESASLASVPTTNEAAYDLFLRAEYQSNKAFHLGDTARGYAAVSLYRQAVEQDPNFALAWARLSTAESQLAWNGSGGMNVKQLNRQARADAERALQLRSDLAAAHLAIGYSDYYGRGDYAAALQAFAAALKLKPNDVNALEAQGFVERRQGRFDDAANSFRQALTLDPISVPLLVSLADTYMMFSRYSGAKSAYQHVLALDPGEHNSKLGYSNAILFSTGDIPRALSVVQGDDPALKNRRVKLLTYQRKYREALALLNSIPDTLDNFSPGSGGFKPLQQAKLYWLMDDRVHARPLYAQSLSPLRTQLKMLRGINLAIVWLDIANVEVGLGQTAAGLDAIAKSLKILDNTKDQVDGPGLMLFGAQLYAQARRPALAVPLLARALATPGIGIAYSPVLLWLDPYWDPIRSDPGFQALLQKYAQYKPAVSPPLPAASTELPQ